MKFPLKVVPYIQAGGGGTRIYVGAYVVDANEKAQADFYTYDQAEVGKQLDLADAWIEKAENMQGLLVAAIETREVCSGSTRDAEAVRRYLAS